MLKKRIFVLVGLLGFLAGTDQVEARRACCGTVTAQNACKTGLCDDPQEYPYGINMQSTWYGRDRKDRATPRAMPSQATSNSVFANGRMVAVIK
jgi:hypothetical protein